VEITGLHNLKVIYCGCAQLLHPWQQLMRAGLFPATEKRPKTTVVFNVLEAYQKLSYTAKMNGYDFFRFMLARTDPLETDHQLVCSASQMLDELVLINMFRILL
jgi:hypothetical protein